MDGEMKMEKLTLDLYEHLKKQGDDTGCVKLCDLVEAQQNALGEMHGEYAHTVSVLRRAVEAAEK
jgi:hypothetical protein